MTKKQQKYIIENHPDYNTIKSAKAGRFASYFNFIDKKYTREIHFDKISKLILEDLVILVNSSLDEEGELISYYEKKKLNLLSTND